MEEIVRELKATGAAVRSTKVYDGEERVVVGFSLCPERNRVMVDLIEPMRGHVRSYAMEEFERDPARRDLEVRRSVAVAVLRLRRLREDMRRQWLERIVEGGPMSLESAMVAMSLSPATMTGLGWRGGLCLANEHRRRYRMGVDGDTLTLLTASYHAYDWQPTTRIEGSVFTVGELET